MKAPCKQVYQFKISLLDVKPEIWRRIQVPDYYTVEDLHIAIQTAMGWEDQHLYQFSYSLRDMIPEDFLIRNIFSLEKDHKNSKICYEYDFGDSWLHEVSLEKILPAKSNVQYPICSAGKRACPPEDCGGAPGYYNLLRIIKNPKHPEHDSMMEWLEEDFDPEDFDPKGICFDDE